MADPTELLRIEDLVVTFPGPQGAVRVVDGVSLSVAPGQVMGLVGESGSGKTVTATAVMGLSRPPARVSGGHIWFGGAELETEDEAAMAKVRGAQISMIFQSPRSHLNPLMKVGDQVARVLHVHQGLRGPAARAEVFQLLRLVGLSDAEVRAESYPHQLSGGMCQRVMIAMALACRPELLIADEPTTGLDVTIEAQIFDLIKDLQQRGGMSVLLITHDLGVVADICHRVAVMHAGHVVEVGDVGTIFDHHRHPYTDQLFGSLLRIDRDGATAADLRARPGVDHSIPGCRYANKCPVVTEVCWSKRPAMHQIGDNHWVMCHQFEGDGNAARS